MSPQVKAFFQRWMVTTLAVAVAANIVRGISYDDWPGLFLGALLLGILNAFLRPLLLLLSLPLLLFTLGLFTLVINAVLLLLVGWLLGSFHVQDFWAAFWGGLVISLVSLTVNVLLGNGEVKARIRSSNRDDRPAPPKGGGGPIIDV